MSLSELKPGQIAVVEQVKSDHFGQSFTNRLAAMGIVPDRVIQVLRVAGFGGPLHIRVGLTTEVAIRRQEAENVMVTVV